MKQLGKMAIGVASGVILAGAGPASGILIDSFDSGFGAVDSINDPGPTNFPSGDAIGGSRTLEILDFPAGSGNLSQGAELATGFVPNPPPGTGALGHSQDSFAPGGRSKVSWTAGGVDLTEGGLADGVMFEILAIDQGNVDLTLTITDTAGNSSELPLAGLGTGASSFLFTNFTGNADFADADMIMLTIDAGEASDFTLDLLETVPVPPPPPPPGNGVPEPISATLGMMGLGALGYATKRRGI